MVKTFSSRVFHAELLYVQQARCYEDQVRLLLSPEVCLCLYVFKKQLYIMSEAKPQGYFSLIMLLILWQKLFIEGGAAAGGAEEQEKEYDLGCLGDTL